MPEIIPKDKIPQLIKELKPFLERAFMCNIIEFDTVPFWKVILYMCEVIKSGTEGVYSIKFKNGMVFQPRLLEETIPLKKQYTTIESRIHQK